MKVLVTGATGFIGMHLVNNLLSQGNIEVRCLVKKPTKVPTSWKGKVEIIIGDITNHDILSRAVKDIDIVYHLAAIATISKRVSEKDYYKVNYKATISLASKCAKVGVKKFIFFSSIEAIGGIERAIKEQKVINEDFKGEPVNIYGRSKLKAEKELLNLFRKEGFPVSIVRPTVVYGPYMRAHHGPLKLIKALDEGIFMFVGSGDNLVSWTYVENVVKQAIVVANSKKSNGQVYILSDKKPYKFKKIVYLICKYLGKVAPKRSIPYWAARILSIPIECMYNLMNKEPPLSKGKLMYMTGTYIFDASKIRRELGFSNEITLEEGIRRTINWYKNYYKAKRPDYYI